MFGISFSELLIIGVVGLVVLGPERLPAVARTLGRLLRQVQGYADAFKAELNRELHNAEILQLEKEMREEGRRLKDDVSSEVAPVFKQTADEVNDAQQDILQNWHAGSTLDHTAAIPDADTERQTDVSARERSAGSVIGVQPTGERPSTAAVEASGTDSKTAAMPQAGLKAVPDIVSTGASATSSADTMPSHPSLSEPIKPPNLPHPPA